MRSESHLLRLRRRRSRGTIFGLQVDAILAKFFADRGTHLAAMIAYFALLSFVPLLFLFSAYFRLANVRQTPRDVLPGAVIATIALEATFQVLPIYLRLSQHVPALQALGGPAILLVWLYVMANVIVFGAEVNWWVSNRLRADHAPEEAPGLA